MKRLLAMAAIAASWVSVASGAEIFRDGFEDGERNVNQTWQVLNVPGVTDGHEQRWTVTSSQPLVGNASLRWSDQPSCTGQVVLGGDCFPAGVIYTQPSRSPSAVARYRLRSVTKLEDLGTIDLEGFDRSSALGPFLWPPNDDQLAGGFIAALAVDSENEKVDVGILYAEAFVATPNVADSTVRIEVPFQTAADIPYAAAYAPHTIDLVVRDNRFLELAVDGKYYGSVDTRAIPGALLTPADMNDVALVGLAENVVRFDDVLYDDAIPARSPGTGVPAIYAGGPDCDCDGIRDAADPDRDGDGIVNFEDGSNDCGPNLDGDGFPDACDDDRDGDGCRNASDPNDDPVAPDCGTVSGLGGTECVEGVFSHDCDGDRIPNDCEIPLCNADACDSGSFCDQTPPSISFRQPAPHALYVQDSMAVGLPSIFASAAVSSMTIAVEVVDAGKGVDPSSVRFEVDENPIPEADVRREPPRYSFVYDVTGVETAIHEVVAFASDQVGNAASARTDLFVVDASPLTDAVATDVTDQYAVVIEPGPVVLVSALGAGVANTAVLRAEGGRYTVRYRVEDAHWLVGGQAAVVPTCHSNVLHVGHAEGISRAIEDGIPSGFWHDAGYTIFQGGVDCSGADSTGAFSGGVYTLEIPATALASVAGEAVYLWVYVDVPERAATENLVFGPAFVDSASGFYNPLKILTAGTGLADRFDEVPAPILVVPE